MSAPPFADPVLQAPSQDVAGQDVFVLPASFAQRRLWFIDQLEPGRPTYNVSANFRLQGELNAPALARALADVVTRHEVLRTVFQVTDGAPMQVILPPAEVPLPIDDLRAVAEPARAAAIDERVRAESTRPFDLATGPVLRAALLRTAEHEHLLLLTIHHIAVDGWSLGVIQRELAAAYAARLAGSAPVFPELPIQYADFAVWQHEQEQAGALEAQLDYWREQLGGPLPVLELLTDRPRLTDRDRHAAAVPFQLPADVSDAITALGREAGTTPFATLLAAYQLLLHQYTGQDQVIVGSPVAGRTRRETEGLVGLFVNTLAVRTRVREDESFRALLSRVRDTVHGALANQDVPFERIVDAVQAGRDRARTPVFETLFSFQDFAAGAPLELSGLTVQRIAGARGVAKFDLQLIVNRRPDGFRGTLEYDASLFEEATAQRMMTHLAKLLTSIARAPDVPVRELSLLDAAERELVVAAWNDTDTPWPEQETLTSLLAAQAARTPDAPALLQGETTLTYRDLFARANRLAHLLREQGVEPEQCVGVCLPRTPELVIALLAVHAAGGAYVPLDPAYPTERLRYMLTDSQARVVITDTAHRSRVEAEPLPADGALAAGPLQAILVDDADTRRSLQSRPSDAPPVAAGPTALAYVIYTSGSTGRPKGVAIEHRSAVALVSWAQGVYSAAELSGVLAATSICFDLSVFELFVPLASGGSVILAENALALPELPAGVRERVTLVNTVPSAAAALVRAGGVPQSVQTVNLAGEPLSAGLVDALYGLGTVGRVYDLYGPSEDTTYSTGTLRRAGGPVTIGRPIANTRAYVLDGAGAPRPVGLAGELYLGGAGLARGYLGQPALTAERFVAHPEFGRLYRTGDRVRWRGDGTLEYLGRLDFQVKIRGFRVEPGEIEALLATHPAVHEATVVARSRPEADGTAPADRQLVAYVVTRPEAGSPPTPADLRAWLRERLPEHMVPAAIVALAELPRTANGKLDRNALPAPDLAGNGTRPAALPPRTSVEHQLWQIWSSLLGGRAFGIQDDFFECGGHSLLAVRMLSEVQRLTGHRLSLASLFEGATIERLAARIEGEVHVEAEPPSVVLQAEGNGRPFVFLHGDVRGGGWYCRRLAPLLGADTPMIVLPTLRPAGPGSSGTVEEMAARHLRTLRELQPHGPYRLGGYCAGGMIAFEMARQLRAAGEVVERLVLLDTVAGNARFRRLAPLLEVAARLGGRDGALERRARWLQQLRYYSGRLRSVRRGAAGSRWEWLAANVRRRLRTAAPAAERDAAPERGAELNTRPGTELLRFQGRAAGAYVPRPYDGEIELIVAVDPTGAVSRELTLASALEAGAPELRAGRRGWERVARTVNVTTIPSTHVGLITEDLETLAGRLREILAGPRADA